MLLFCEVQGKCERESKAINAKSKVVSAKSEAVNAKGEAASANRGCKVLGELQSIKRAMKYARKSSKRLRHKCMGILYMC